MRATQVILGTGAIGRAIMHELRTRGEAVRMVNRSGTMAEAPADVEIVAADLYDAAQVRAVCAEARVVYHTVQPDYHQWPRWHFPRRPGHAAKRRYPRAGGWSHGLRKNRDG